MKERIIRFRDLGLKDNVAQLVAFQRRSGAGAGGPADGGDGTSSQTSSEGSAGSLAGQKRRQVEQGSSPAAAAASASEASTGGQGQHLRFESSDSEAEAAVQARGGSAKRRAASESGVAAPLAALEAVTIEDAVAAAGPGSPTGHRPGGRRQWVAGDAAVEEATQAADADAAAAAQGQQQRLPSLVVSNIHVLFNPRRGDLKMGQVCWACQGWWACWPWLSRLGFAVRSTQPRGMGSWACRSTDSQYFFF